MELPTHSQQNFEALGVPSFLIEPLSEMNISSPTPIQEKAIPIALSGQDILASAQTGSGKTVAYCIPLILKLIRNKKSTALILAPTRELALQVQQVFCQMSKIFSLKTTLLIGGTPYFKQLRELKRKPQLVVGTPGRVSDHLQRGTLELDHTEILIIDEADRMLDMGFGIQLDNIAEYLPENRQTLMFSATFPANIEKLSQKYLKNPQRITIGSSTQSPPKIKQESLYVAANEKMSSLLNQLDQREGSAIVFVKTKMRADRLAKDLKEQGHLAEAIHGDLPQKKRDYVIRTFQNKKCRILVATDIAARGLDVPHVMHVINYDLPQCPEDYVHRIGRTARAGAEGNALCFISSEEVHLWKAICRLIEPHANNEVKELNSSQKAKKTFGKGKKQFFKKRSKSSFFKKKKLQKV